MNDQDAPTRQEPEVQPPADQALLQQLVHAIQSLGQQVGQIGQRLDAVEVASVERAATPPYVAPEQARSNNVEQLVDEPWRGTLEKFADGGNERITDWLMHTESRLSICGQRTGLRRILIAGDAMVGIAHTWFLDQAALTNHWNEQWDAFAAAARYRFYNHQEGALVRQKLAKLKMSDFGGDLVRYTDAFLDLVRRVPDMAAGDQIQHFASGLEKSIKQHVLVNTPANLEEARKFATTFASVGTVWTEPSVAVPMDLGQLTTAINRLVAARGPARRRNGFCYNCGQDGHYKNECRNPPNRALVERRRASTLRNLEAPTSELGNVSREQA